MTRWSISYHVFRALTVMTLIATAAINGSPSASAPPSTGSDNPTASAPSNSWQTAQLARTLTGHSQAVDAIAISPDGQTMISGSSDRTIKVWELKTGKLLRTLTGHSDTITSLAISPNGETLVSGSAFQERAIKLWNLKTGELIHTLPQEAGPIQSLAITPVRVSGAALEEQGIGYILASGIRPSVIKLWELQTGKLIRQFEDPALELALITSIAFSPNGQMLAGSFEDGRVKLWNWVNGELLHTLYHPDSLRAIAFSQDGQTLVSESFDETVKVWNPQTGALISTPVENPDFVFVNAFALHPSGQILASALGPDGELRLWNLQTGDKINTLRGFSGSIFSLAFSPDGQILVSGSNDGTITIWQP